MSPYSQPRDLHGGRPGAKSDLLPAPPGALVKRDAFLADRVAWLVKGLSPMKKGGILNPAICSLLAELGQSDELLIVDAAYPLPTDGHVIDLTLTPGIPRLLDILRAVSEELVIDAIAVPAEIKEYSPRIYQEILKMVGDTDVDEIPFHEFKEQALDVKGIIRSAEFSPYASVRIVAGSAF